MGIQKYVGEKVWGMILSSMEHCTAPAVFNDPVAEKTEWNDLEGGGGNFQTHKLVHVGNDRIEYKISVGKVLFSSLFVVIGAGIGIFGGLMSDNPLPLSLLGLAFFIAGSFMLYFGSRPIVFDKRKMLFWKGKMPQHGSALLRERKNCARLGEIYALQVLSKKHSDSRRSKPYRTYGILLVFKDGFRIKVIDHVDKGKAREDAKALSEFLNRPLWDGADMEFIDKGMFRSLYKQAQEHPEKIDEGIKRRLEGLKEKFSLDV